jgi:hypothetical protein
MQIRKIASFATYPVVKLEKLQREFTNYVVVGMVSLFSLIGFICGLATSIQMSPYLNLTICGLLTTVVFNVAYLFNLAVELYAVRIYPTSTVYKPLATFLKLITVVIVVVFVGSGVRYVPRNCTSSPRCHHHLPHGRSAPCHHCVWCFLLFVFGSHANLLWDYQ